jgi:Ca-activated chloride channel family protein
MSKRVTILFSLFQFIILSALAQKENENIYQGNQFYKEGKYEQAIAEYQKALLLNPSNQGAKFNLANALYRIKSYPDAEKGFLELNEVEDKTLAQRSTYNKGVLYSREKKLLESIEAYKMALIMNPGDENARINLQKALEELKKMNPPQKKQDQKKQQQQQKQPPPKTSLNKKQIEQYLKSLQQKEQEVQQKMQNNKSRAPQRPDKDW